MILHLSAKAVPLVLLCGLVVALGYVLGTDRQFLKTFTLRVYLPILLVVEVIFLASALAEKPKHPMEAVALFVAWQALGFLDLFGLVPKS